MSILNNWKPKVAMEQPITENVIEAAVDEPTSTKQVTDESIVEKATATEITEPESVEEVKPQIPPKPEMPPEAAIYPKLKKIDAELKQKTALSLKRNMNEVFWRLRGAI